MSAALRHSPFVLAAVLATSCDGCGGGEILVDAIEPVAECVSSSGDVRRRLARGTAWSSLAAGAALFSGDWVQTAPRATARVQFTDGSDLWVEPSTTVVIEAPDEAPSETAIRRIAVRSGAVRAGFSRGRRRRVQVRLPQGRTVELAPDEAVEQTDVRIRVGDGGAAEVAVTRGAVALTTAEGRRLDVASGSALRLEADREPTTKRLPAAPTLEAVGEGRPIYLGTPVTFRWSTPEPGRRYRLELSRGLGFFDRVLESDGPSAVWTPEVPARWEARVYALDEDGRRSPASNAERIVIVPDDRWRLLVAPADATTFRVASGRARVDLEWRPHPEGGPYRVTLARGEDLEASFSRVEVEGRTAYTARLSPGVYAWGVHRGEVPLFVEPFRFRVVRSGSDLRVPSRLDWR